MARLYADEQFPYQVVEHLRDLGHDVLTVQEAGNANLKIPDSPRPSDDPKTDYKCFKGCGVFYGKSQEMLEEEEWLFTDENVTVIIYC